MGSSNAAPAWVLRGRIVGLALRRGAGRHARGGARRDGKPAAWRLEALSPTHAARNQAQVGHDEGEAERQQHLSQLLAGETAQGETLEQPSADTSGGPNVLKVRGPAIVKALAGQDLGPPAFDVDSIRKDLRTMVAEGRGRGIEPPLAARTLAIYDEAADAG